MEDNKGTPSKDTGAKNNNSDNDVDFKNNMSNTSSKKQGKSSVSNSITDYRHNPKVETPNPKATSDKGGRR